MPTFFMLGRYSSEGIKDVSADRTKKVIKLVQELGGKIKSIHALLGRYDCAIIVDLPNLETAMKASLALNILTGISFESFPTVSIDDFDRILAKE